MTNGEYKVGISFNPSSDSMVDKIKRQAADLIDLICSIEGHVPEFEADDPDWARTHEIGRLKALAITATEEAAMWAVKAATKQRRES